MQHIHDSRLQLRALHCADLIEEAAQVRLAAQASGKAPAFSRLAGLLARCNGAWHALSQGPFLPFSRTMHPAAQPRSSR